jgi:hypothetical protein
VGIFENIKYMLKLSHLRATTTTTTSTSTSTTTATVEGGAR